MNDPVIHIKAETPMAGWVSMKRASLLIAVLACHTSGPDRATPAPAGFVARTTVVDGATYRYQVFVPRHVGRARPPVILSLHGAGERGSDGELQTRSEERRVGK